MKKAGVHARGTTLIVTAGTRVPSPHDLVMDVGM